MRYDVYLVDGTTEQAELLVTPLHNGFDSYILLVNGGKVRTGLVDTGKAGKQVKKYFAGRPSVECVFECVS